MSAATGYQKKAIPNVVRREVALRYGCPPGGRIHVPCHYCGKLGVIHWWPLPNGQPSGWVSFGHQLDHVVPEFHGGPMVADNFVLACKSCNCSKGAKI